MCFYPSNIKNILTFSIALLLSFGIFTSPSKASSQQDCLDTDKSKLSSGWFLFEPYQFQKETTIGSKLQGMDIELAQIIAKMVGIEVEYKHVEWKQQQSDLRTGAQDMASGATYTDERTQYVYFSDPYRFEENSLFMLKDSDKEFNFSNIQEFLTQVRLQNFKLGVLSGFIYADDQINVFVRDASNSDIIFSFNNDVESLQALIRGEIDGFITDRVVGAALSLNNQASSKVIEVPLHIKTPIHFMFSKKTVPTELVDKFNQKIKEFLASSEYRNIVKIYLYPVLILQTIDSKWFYFIGVIGTIAFAISGIAIAAKENATLFGTFLFAMTPSVGGGIMRDILINKHEVGIFLTPNYMYYILITVLIGFFIIRVLEYYNKGAGEDTLIKKFWEHILIIGDALGQAAFIVTGVAIALAAKIQPIELWGPFFAFMTANGGGILRDLLRKGGSISCLTGEVNPEISIIWGLLFSIFLNINSYNPDSAIINKVVVFVVIGAFVTRLITYYLKVPNIKFKSDEL